MERIILSDVCDTLIDLNSTYSYIDFLYKHNYGNKIIGYLLNNRFFKLFSFAIFKLTKCDIDRSLTFRFFKNLKVPDLKNINEEFWEFYISKRTKILDMIINHIEKGDKVILVSASINPPIDMLGNYLLIDYFSSELEEKDGIYTGKVKEDYLGNKESLLVSKKIDILKYDNVVFYTDNLTDIGFISKVQELAKESKFFLIVKSDTIKNKREKFLHSNNIKNYEFIS